jgi:hypothetical protein
MVVCRDKKKRMKGTTEPFRISFWWQTIYCVGVGTGIAVPLVLVLTAIDGYMGNTIPSRILWPAIAAAVAGAELVGAIAVLIMWWLRPIYVSPERLVAFRTGGGYRQVRWTDITSVRPVNFLGLRYLRVSTNESKHTLWVPLYLSNREEFYWRVCEYAGPQHPLAVALQAEHSVS